MARQRAAGIARDDDGSAVSRILYDVDGRQPEFGPHAGKVARGILILETCDQAAIAVFALIKQQVQSTALPPLHVPRTDHGRTFPERTIA